MVTYLTYGAHVIYSTSAPTTSFDTTALTEGLDYIDLNGSPRRAWNVTFVDGVMDLPGGWSIGIALGDFAETMSVSDIKTEAQLAKLERFVKRNSQSPYNSNLYLMVVTATGSPPTCRTFYKNVDDVGYAYMPVYLSGISADWDEKNQMYNVRLALKACWT